MQRSLLSLGGSRHNVRCAPMILSLRKPQWRPWRDLTPAPEDGTQRSDRIAAACVGPRLKRYPKIVLDLNHAAGQLHEGPRFGVHMGHEDSKPIVRETLEHLLHFRFLN